MDWTKLTGIVLALGAVVSVLAFGGVDTLAFAPVGLAIAILAVTQFWRTGFPSAPRSVWWIVGIVAGIPIVQLIPLSDRVLAAISPARLALAQGVFSSIQSSGSKFTISVDPYATQIALLKLTCYVLVFLLALQASKQRRQQSLLIRVVILLGIFEAVYGMVQYLTGWQYIFTFAKQINTTVATGTYINPDNFAGFLEMVLPFALARPLLRNPDPSGTPRFRWKQLIVLSPNSHLFKDILIIAVIAVGLVFSESRSGILTAVLGSLIVIGIAYLRTRRRSVIVMGLLLFALPLTYAVWIGIDPVNSRFRGLLLSGNDKEARLSIWRDSIALVRENPLLGTGLGTYTWSSRHYQTSALGYVYDHAHNDYLEFAADIGFPGAVLLFSGLWALTVKIGRKVLVLAGSGDCIAAAGCTGAIASLLIHGLTDFNLQIPANAFVFAWIAGTAAALVRKPTTGAPEPRHRSARLAFHGRRDR